MRKWSWVLLTTMLVACSLGEEPAPVDPDNLPPMSGQERALLIAADAAAATGDVDAAERNYLNAAAKSKGHIDAHLALADLYQRTKQPEHAREVLERAARFQPGNAEVNRLLGKLAIGEGKPEAAIDYFTRGLQTAPTSMDLLTGAGVANDMLRRHEAAQSLYKRALEFNPKADLGSVRINMAMSYLLSNQPKKAVEILKREAQKKNASPVARHNLALAYGLLGQHTKAKAILKGDLNEDQRQESIARIKRMIEAEVNVPTPPVHQP